MFCLKLDHLFIYLRTGNTKARAYHSITFLLGSLLWSFHHFACEVIFSGLQGNRVPKC